MKFDWADTIRDFTRRCGMTTRDFLEGQTFAQFAAVWLTAPNTSTGLDMDTLRAQINRKRAAKGLPPMRKPTAEEIKAAHAKVRG